MTQPEHGSRDYLLARVHGDLERDRRAAEHEAHARTEAATSRSRERKEAIAAGKCPRCYAAPGEPCTARAGHSLKWRHAGRPVEQAA